MLWFDGDFLRLGVDFSQSDGDQGDFSQLCGDLFWLDGDCSQLSTVFSESEKAFPLGDDFFQFSFVSSSVGCLG